RQRHPLVDRRPDLDGGRSPARDAQPAPPADARFLNRSSQSVEALRAPQGAPSTRAAARAAISLLIVAVLTVVLLGSFRRDLIADRLWRIGFQQSWDVYAPEPIRRTQTFESIITHTAGAPGRHGTKSISSLSRSREGNHSRLERVLVPSAVHVDAGDLAHRRGRAFGRTDPCARWRL